MGAEPPTSHWRQLLDRARLEEGVLPSTNPFPSEATSRGGAALHVFRQRSLLQEEWLHMWLPQSKSQTRSRLPTLLAGTDAMKGGLSTKSSFGSVGPISSSSLQSSFWSRLASRCFASLIQRCSKGYRSEAESLPGIPAPAEEPWPICQDIKDAWASAFSDLSLAVTGRAWPRSEHEEICRHSVRACTVPVLGFRQRPPTVKIGQGPLIELFYIIESPASCEKEGTPSVVRRFPPVRYADARAVQTQAMLDCRIAAFCCTEQVHERTPFAFTILAAVLPPPDSGEVERTSSADPTDFLYCTAVCFDKDGGRLAYCIVSRHPFMEAFGSLLLILHDGEEVPACFLEGDEAPEEEEEGLGSEEGEGPELDCLGRVAKRLLTAVPRVRPDTRRSRTEPAKLGRADLEEETARSFAERMGAERSLRSAYGREEGEPMRKLSLDSFSYPARSRQLRSRLEEDLRLRCTVLLEWAGPELFSRFTLQALLEVVLALLLEVRVAVISESPELGSKLVLGLGSLLWPFSWQHLLLPICPSYLQEAIIEAPVPFICALPEITHQVASARTSAAFTPRGLLGSAAARRGLVLCDADMGTVSIPPGFEGLLRADLPQFRRLREDPRAHCRLCECEGFDPLEAKALAVSKVLALQAGLSSIADSLVEVSGEVSHEPGGVAWLCAMEALMGDALQLQQSSFLKAFLNTETCLMYLALGA